MDGHLDDFVVEASQDQSDAASTQDLKNVIQTFFDDYLAQDPHDYSYPDRTKNLLVESQGRTKQLWESWHEYLETKTFDQPLANEMAEVGQRLRNVGAGSLGLGALYTNLDLAMYSASNATRLLDEKLTGYSFVNYSPGILGPEAEIKH